MIRRLLSLLSGIPAGLRAEIELSRKLRAHGGSRHIAGY